MMLTSSKGSTIYLIYEDEQFDGTIHSVKPTHTSRDKAYLQNMKSTKLCNIFLYDILFLLSLHLSIPLQTQSFSVQQ